MPRNGLSIISMVAMFSSCTRSREIFNSIAPGPAAAGLTPKTFRECLELRFAKGLTVREAKTEDGSIGTISGQAAPFDKWSEDLGYFREIIRPGAFKKTLSSGSGVDARALVDHDTGRIIGRRSAKTLSLEENAQGLQFEVRVPDTTAGRDVLASVKRGDLTGMSFGFSTISDSWGHRTEGGVTIYERELLEVDLFEVSIVAFPAYTDTSAEARTREFRSLKNVLEEHRRRGATDGHARRDRLIRQFEVRKQLWTPA